MEIRVSVIIPIYNAEKWLSECLDSVCGQSLENIEIVCINDGSPDDSLAILKEYAARDSRIVIIDKQNEGVGAARNDGIRAAKGEYIAFMDPDDKYPGPAVLETLYRAAVENKVSIAGGYLGSMNERGERIPKGRSYFGIDFSCKGLVPYSEFQCDFQFSAYLYDRAFLLRNGLFFPTYLRFQDPPFFVNAMLAAGSFYAVDQMTYVYRVGGSKPSFQPKKVLDAMRGMSDNLRRSRETGLARLHYLSAMRLLTDASVMVNSLADDEAFESVLWQYIKALGLIDEDLIRDGGYSLPEPVLPKVFINLTGESRQYRSLIRHKSVRALRKLFARGAGSRPGAQTNKP